MKSCLFTLSVDGISLPSLKIAITSFVVYVGFIVQALIRHNFKNLFFCCITYRKSISFNLLFKVVQSIRVAFMVDLSFSGPRIAKVAFGLAGASDALVFLLLAFSIDFIVVEHGACHS